MGILGLICTILGVLTGSDVLKIVGAIDFASSIIISEINKKTK